MTSISWLTASLQMPVEPSLLTTLPPAVVVFIIAVAVGVLPRQSGHAFAVLACLAVAVWPFAVPTGAHVPVQFLGFDAVLFNVDTLSRLLGATFGAITSITALYAYGSGRDSKQTALGIAYAGTAMGVVFAGDWLTLLAFWEVMSVVSATLLWSSGGRAVRAGFRYAVFHAIGGVFLLSAVALHYVQGDSFLFSATAGIEPGMPAALAVVGIGVNAGFVGVHTWIPDAYPKPHFVTSVVLCGFTTKAAIYALYRAFPDGHLFIAYMGVAMTLFGVTYALVQTNMRRLLSYHIQSQVGYMVVGIGIGTSIGVAGGFAHLVNNVLYKSLLFMVAGAILYRTGRDDLKKVGGLYRAMPLTFVAFLVAAFAIAGVPGFNGFVSKEIVKAAAKKEQLTTLKWLLTIAGVGTTMSFVKFGYYSFIHGDSDTEVQDATPAQTVAMLGIATICLLYGLYPSALLNFLPGASAVTQSVEPYAARSVFDAFAYIAIGIVGFFFIRPYLAKVRNVPDVDTIYNPAAFYGLQAVADGYYSISSGLKHRVHSMASIAGSVATAADPLSRISGGRLTMPASVGINQSIMLLALLAVGLLVALLV